MIARETWPEVTNKDADGIKRMWEAALTRQVKDAVDPEANEHPTVQTGADSWLRYGGKDFIEVCDAAGWSPSKLRQRYEAGLITKASLKPAR